MSRVTGLGLLGPRVRVVVVLVLTSLFVFADTLWLATAAAAIGVVLLALQRNIRFPRLLMILLASNLVFIFAGNVVFSPPRPDSLTFWIFRINQQGVMSGAIGCLKRGGMLLVSFAWLSSVRRMDDMVDAFMFSNAPAWRKAVLLFFRELENVTGDLRNQYDSTMARGLNGRTWSPSKRLYQGYLMLNASVMRLFKHITALTLAGETHFSANAGGAAGNVEARHLSVRYMPDAPDAVRDFTARFCPGEVVCLVGPNETGKSTLLQSIAGVIPWLIGYFSSGEVLIDGVSHGARVGIRQIAGQVRYVGSRSRDSFVGLTVKREMLTLTADELEARRWLHVMDIGHLWDAEISTLSGGQQMRLAIVGALASGASCLLFDSPLGELDADGRRSFIAAVRKIVADRRCLIVIADEDFEPYLSIATRILSLPKSGAHREVTGPFDSARAVHSALQMEQGAVLSCEQDVPASQKRVVAALHHVSVKRGGVVILQDVSMEVRSGECLMIVGPNGGGKTTIALTLAGVIVPVSGERLAKDVTFGVAFQRPEDFLLESSCARELAVKPRLLDWDGKSIESYVQEALQRLGLSGDTSTLELHPVRAKMLACLAGAAAAQVVIFDEPTAEMDVANVMWFVRLVNSLLKDGVGVVIISHDRRIERLASRTLRVEGGRVFHPSAVAA